MKTTNRDDTRLFDVTFRAALAGCLGGTTLSYVAILAGMPVVAWMLMITGLVGFALLIGLGAHDMIRARRRTMRRRAGLRALASTTMDVRL